MDPHLLTELGLSLSQAKAYIALIEARSSDAPSIAKAINESRSNTYKILDKLCEMELVRKDGGTSKIIYQPANPALLTSLVEKRLATAELQQRKLTAAMPSLLSYYFTHAEQPGITFYQGKQRIKQIFTEMLKTGQTLYLLRTPADVDFYDAEFFNEIRQKRRMLNIKTVGITPDVASANHDPALDTKNLFKRIWLAPEVYTANVEWNIAGNKVALISYDQEAMGMIIESPQIAESFRQIFSLVQQLADSKTDSVMPEAQ